MRSLAAGLVLSSSPVATGAPARCDSATAPWVHVDGSALDPGTRGQFFEELRAALGARKIGACLDGTGGTATVTILRNGPGALSIVVGDRATKKRVERDFIEADVPEDGRALALALAADELLRATWAELLLPDPPADVVAVREELPELVPAVRPPPPAQSRFLWSVGALAAGDALTKGALLFGVDVFAARRIAGSLSLEARGGGRSSSAIDVPDGRVEMRTLRGGGGPAVRVTAPASPVEVVLVARVDLDVVRFAADARVPAQPRDASALAIYAGSGARLSRGLGSGFTALGEAGVFAPLRAAIATDRALPATGISGTRISVALGIGYAP